MLTIFSYFSTNNVNGNAIAATTQPQISGRSGGVNYSIFIHSPTYSILYYRNIYFIDEYDKLLKVYDLNQNKFLEKSVNLNTIDEIIDVDYIDDCLYLLTYNSTNEKYELIFINLNLTSFEIENILTFETLTGNYEKFDVTKNGTNLIVSLTPSANESETSPAIIVIDDTNKTITNTCLLNVELLNEANLFKMLTILASDESVNEIYVVLVYNYTISFVGTDLTTISNSTLDVNISSAVSFDSLETSNEDISFNDVNKILVNDDLLFLITYNTEINENSATEIQTSSHLYEFAIDDVVGTNRKFISRKTISHKSTSSYILTSNGTVVYPVENKQQIIYTEITYDASSEKYSDNTPDAISNPIVEVEYKTEAQFEYVYANKKTPLLSSPWAAETSETFIIDPVISQKDIIIIGDGIISGSNSPINDYKFCMVTTGDQNLKGYIKTEDLTPKEKISIDDYDYEKIVKVQPNTILYSMPTTIIGDNVTPNSPSYVIDEIKDNSRVEIIDTICKYKSNEKRLVKVKVNDSLIGYIECDKIVKPSASISFVITNASIKNNNTAIYRDSNPNSPIIYTLNKGYRIRINGPRNTETGYTSVTFNDEYGNEFSGYILTDAIGSDSWTVMQIIGCVLIAINIGLLILILRFKKKNIGPNGAKYIDNEKK